MSGESVPPLNWSQIKRMVQGLNLLATKIPNWGAIPAPIQGAIMTAVAIRLLDLPVPADADGQFGP